MAINIAIVTNIQNLKKEKKIKINENITSALDMMFIVYGEGIGNSGRDLLFKLLFISHVNVLVLILTFYIMEL